MDTVKIVVVGDGSVGKTSLLITYTTGDFPSDFVPSVSDAYSANMMVDGRPVNVALWDTAGQEDYDRLRPLMYPDTDCFCVCADLSKKASIRSARDKWVPEITRHCPDVPFIVVGTKEDVSDEAESAADLRDVAHETGARGLFVTSSLEEHGVDELFAAAAHVALERRRGGHAPNRFNRPCTLSARLLRLLCVCDSASSRRRPPAAVAAPPFATNYDATRPERRCARCDSTLAPGQARRDPVLGRSHVCATCLAARAAAATRIQARLRGVDARTRKRACPICLDEKPRALFVWACASARAASGAARASRCCDKVCSGCLARYVGAAVDEGRLHVRCPGDGCRELLSSSDVLAAVGPAKHATLAVNARARHGGRVERLLESTDAADAAFIRWARENTRACPSCSVIIYRYAGCNHMTCRCGASFQWDEAEFPAGEAPVPPPSPRCVIVDV